MKESLWVLESLRQETVFPDIPGICFCRDEDQEGLALINQDEARLLKSRGGSGSPVSGTRGLGPRGDAIRSYKVADEMNPLYKGIPGYGGGATEGAGQGGAGSDDDQQLTNLQGYSKGVPWTITKTKTKDDGEYLFISSGPGIPAGGKWVSQVSYWGMINTHNKEVAAIKAANDRKIKAHQKKLLEGYVYKDGEYYLHGTKEYDKKFRKDGEFNNDNSQFWDTNKEEWITVKDGTTHTSSGMVFSEGKWHEPESEEAIKAQDKATLSDVDYADKYRPIGTIEDGKEWTDSGWKEVFYDELGEKHYSQADADVASEGATRKGGEEVYTNGNWVSIWTDEGAKAAGVKRGEVLPGESDEPSTEKITEKTGIVFDGEKWVDVNSPQGASVLGQLSDGSKWHDDGVSPGWYTDDELAAEKAWVYDQGDDWLDPILNVDDGSSDVDVDKDGDDTDEGAVGEDEWDYPQDDDWLDPILNFDDGLSDVDVDKDGDDTDEGDVDEDEWVYNQGDDWLDSIIKEEKEDSTDPVDEQYEDHEQTDNPLIDVEDDDETTDPVDEQYEDHEQTDNPLDDETIDSDEDEDDPYWEDHEQTDNPLDDEITDEDEDEDDDDDVVLPPSDDDDDDDVPPPPPDTDLNYQTQLDALNTLFTDTLTDDYYEDLESGYETGFTDDLNDAYNAALRSIYSGFKAQGRITEDELAEYQDPLDTQKSVETTGLETLADAYVADQKTSATARKNALITALYGLDNQADIDNFTFSVFGDDYEGLAETPDPGEAPEFFTDFDQIEASTVGSPNPFSKSTGYEGSSGSRNSGRTNTRSTSGSGSSRII